MYCRFCFRKEHLNDPERTLYEGSLEPAYAYLASTPEIRDIILTGGDPLSLTDAALESVFKRISTIPHIKTVRIHSRMAVTLPYRITPALIRVLSGTQGQEWPFQIILNSHFNHPQELSQPAQFALKMLKKHGITLLNQSVLVKGINDSVDCLTTLFQSLYEAGVVPYYLHHPDWTPGTFHFRNSIERGKELMSHVRGRVSGPALPDYVLDLPGGHGKTSLLNSDVRCLSKLGDSESAIRGAIYEIRGPITRSEQNPRLTYLDLFQLEKKSETE